MSNIVDNKLRDKEYSEKLNNIVIDKSYGEFIAGEILEEVRTSDRSNVYLVESDSTSIRN